MPNLFEHFKASAAYVHKILFIKIVQASEMQYKGHRLSPKKRFPVYSRHILTRISSNFTPSGIIQSVNYYSSCS